MRLKRFFSKRINILAFVTLLFIVVGLLFGYVLPNTLFNNQITEVEERLHDLAVNHDTVTEVNSTQILYIYDNGISSMLTSSGYIDVIDDEVEHHLIHWSHEQVAEDIQSLLYEDDFQNKHYIYYVYIIDDEYYVVSFEDTKEIIMFVDSFRNTSLVAVVIFYILSILFSSTIFSSSLIKQYSLYDPVTNLHTKISLLNKYKNKDLSNYKITYFNIHNFDNIIEAIGARNIDDVLRMISSNLIRNYKESIYQLSSKEFILVEDLESKSFEHFDEIINAKAFTMSELSAYEFKTKIIHIDRFTLNEIGIEELIKRFTFAFSKIKSTKAKSFFVDQKLIVEMENEKYYQSRLANAIKHGNIINYYQPKVDPKTNKIIGAEALSRWIDDGKVVSPANYIYLAEANGLIFDIDMISLKNSIQFIRELEDNELLHDDFKISTNFSPISLKNTTFKQIRNMIEHKHVDPKHISIEITETVVLEMDIIEDLLRKLRDYGVTIEIDDFSAGNSSFTVLSLIDANVVKLDRAILPEKAGDEKEKLIYHSLVDISKKLGLKIISEGVETDIQQSFVRELGVEGVQGYYYSKPLEKGLFINYFKSHNSSKTY